MLGDAGRVVTPGLRQRPPAPDRRPAGALVHPRRPTRRRGDLRLGRAGARRPHRRRRRAVGHARLRRGGHQRHHDAPSRRAPWPIPTASRPAGARSACAARSGRGVGTSTDVPFARAGRRGAGAPGRPARPAAARRPGRGLGDARRPRPDERRARRRAPAQLARDRGHRADVPPVAARRRRRQPTSPAPAAVPSSTSTTSACSGRTCWSPTPCTSTTTRSTSCCAPTRRSPSCPWAYLRLARASPPPDGTPSWSAAAAGSRSAATPRTPATPSTSCGPPRCSPAWPGPRRRPAWLHRPRRARRWPRSAAPRRSAWATAIGSIEVGQAGRPRRARSAAARSSCRRGTDPVLQLVWASDGRSVRDVVVAGRRRGARRPLHHRRPRRPPRRAPRRDTSGRAPLDRTGRARLHGPAGFGQTISPSL